ncbi:MAG: HEAT repeat domain-containing protein [Chloroflexi bacterium]|nr:HEAT repeat domain-containing protein [Chloroflexota bacterium]
MPDTLDITTAIATLQNSDATESELIDAVHALGRQNTAESTEALIAALSHNAYGVRWAAAEALLNHGEPAIMRLLQALETSSDPLLFESAHHVLKRIPGPMLKKAVEPVIEALEGPSPATYAPVEARKVLESLRGAV